MSEQVNKQSKNTVGVEGYLKENNLAKMKTKTGADAINGFLTIAIADGEEHRIRFFANKLNSKGEQSKNYGALEKLLPENTTSIASIMKANPNSTFNEARQEASKVWAWGRFSTYDRKDSTGAVISSATIEGMKGGIKNETEKNPFEPKCEFDVSAYVDNIRAEIVEGEETGRTLVTLSIPDYYNKVNIPIEYVCDASISKQIEHYSTGSCGRFVGGVHNIRTEKKQESKVVEFLDGSTKDDGKTSVTFVNERQIQKMTPPFEEGNDDFISTKEMKAMKTAREAKLSELVYTPKSTTSTNNNFMSTPTEKTGTTGFAL